MNQLAQIQNWLLNLLYQRTILLLIILFCLGISVAWLSLNHLSANLIEYQALENAISSAKSIKQARSLYSSEVVDRIKAFPGIQVAHDYPGKTGAIPVPATYLIQLSQTISEQNPGMSVRFYSEYPFPWRKTEGGARDPFEEEALIYLTNNPQDRFYRVENFQGNSTLRYAEPDVMKASCVACHNSHPDSPKRDWQVGQVRGILEINENLNDFRVHSQNSLQQVSLMLSSISVLALIGLTLAISRLRFFNKELDSLLKKRTAELNTANTELTQVRQEVSKLKIEIDHKKQQKEVDEIVGSGNFDWIAQRGKEWRQANDNE